MSYTGFGEVELINKEGSSIAVLAPKGSTVAKGTAASSLPIVPLLLGAVGLWFLLGRKKGGSQSWR
jgi:hypothetical protein